MANKKYEINPGNTQTGAIVTGNQAYNEQVFGI